MTLAFVCLLISILATGCSLAATSYRLKQSEKERLRLGEENHKLANLVLAEQNERLLLPEDLPRSLPQSNEVGLLTKVDQVCAAYSLPVQAAPNGVDRMLDQIERSSLTKLTPINWGTKAIRATFAGMNSMMLAEFGDLAIRDTPDPDVVKTWTPDLIYKGIIVAGLRGEQMERARRILSNKIAEAASRKKPVKRTRKK